MATGSKVRTKPHWTTAALGTALGAVLTAGGLLAVAFAVSFTNPFELDGDAADGAATGTDWTTEYNNGNLIPPGGVFVSDLGDTIFNGGGSKDELPIEGWKSRSGSPPDKDDIFNAYAISKVDPTNNHTLIYFGADRYDSSGSAEMGFWFFENENLNQASAFTGSHSDNDILVLLEYSSGGTVGSVKVFHWSQALFDDHNSQTSPLVLIGSGSGQGVVCNTTGAKPPGSACITNNSNPAVVPWPYAPKGGLPAGTIPARQFIEGVIDVTALVGDVCISSFMAETRSSFETNAVLKDFALGDINTCSVTAAKACDATKKAYLPADNLYSTEHEITLTNDGGGKIFDVEFQDNVISGDPADEVACDIIKIGNTVVSIPIANATDWNPVNSENITIDLEANTSIKVRLLCLSPQNSFKNVVTVRAKSAGGSLIAANADDEAQESDTNVESCHVNVPAAVDIVKDCKVSIDATSLKPRVCASVAVSNPSANSSQFLTVSSIKNYPGLKSLIDPANPPAGGVDIKSAFTAANGGSSTLALDQTVNFTFCYDPVAADSSPSPVFPPLPNPVLPTTLLNQFAPFLDPGEVNFSDTVQVIATGNASGGTVRDDDAATCPLCPTCPDCPPGT